MFWNYWKRGWWSWLMQVCVNLIGFVVVLPLAFLFSANRPIYFLFATAVILVAVIPVTGWLFEVFARNSARIGADRDRT